jgi:hypothetical protein
MWSLLEHGGGRVGGQHALDIAVDLLGRRCLQASLVLRIEGLELEDEQAV